jgi:hypothetical protein
VVSIVGAVWLVFRRVCAALTARRGRVAQWRGVSVPVVAV